MRSRWSLLALVVACAVAAHAAPFTPALTALQAALDARYQVLDPSVDKQSLLRSKALEVALKALDKRKSTSTSGDVATLSAIAKGIEKAYGANDVDLETGFEALLADEVALQAKAVSDIAQVTDAVARGKLEAALAKADAPLAAAQAAPSDAATVAVRAKSLKSAARLLDAAGAKIAKALFACTVAQGDLFHADLGAAPFDPPSMSARVLSFVNNGKKVIYGLEVSGFTSGATTVDEQVTFAIKGFAGVGVYPVTKVNTSGVAHAEGTYGKDTVFDTQNATGTLVVAYYDKAKHVVGGTFDATFTTRAFVGGVITVTHATGKFRLCKIAP